MCVKRESTGKDEDSSEITELSGPSASCGGGWGGWGT